MLIKRAYKYRIYPTTKQKEKLAQQFGGTRFVYNHFLRRRIDHYAATGKGLSYHDTALALTQLKKSGQFDWLKDVDSQALQQVLRDLDRAYKNFFGKRAAFPNFKRKHDKQSYRYPQRFKLEGSQVYLPKVGWIKAVVHRPLKGTMKNLTVSRNKVGQYFVSIQVEEEIADPVFTGVEIGLDLGLKDFAVTSKGQHFSNPKHLHKSEKRLKRLQRRLSRCKKGSRGREKARQAVSRQHQKVANQRADFLHKLSRQLVEACRLIAIEDLHVAGMLKNHSLAKAIADVGWAEFVRQLQYKGCWYGCQIGQIDRFAPSSKLCSCCGSINHELRLHHRTWICPDCGVLHDRDENASVNILAFCTAGTAGSYAGGEGSSVNFQLTQPLNEPGSYRL
jgi:putative transposase